MSHPFYYHVQESPFHKGCFLRSSMDARNADGPNSMYTEHYDAMTIDLVPEKATD